MKRLRSILSSSVGNVIEWYDFGLFTIFSAVFSKLFFPTTNSKLAFLATLMIFAIGFICRPIGGLLFGYLGDRWGRAKTLRLSILMISVPTLLISFIPTYNQIGIIAPILLLLTRMLQGISIGGEYSGNLIYLAESAPNKHRAFITTFAAMGANFGILLAAFVGILTSFLFDQKTIEMYAWRLPYLVSGILSLFIYYTRLKLNETKSFNQLKINHAIVKNPIKTVFTKNRKQLLITLGMVTMGSTFYYFAFIYIPMYLSEDLKLPMKFVSELMSASIIIMIIISPLAALLCDKFGRRKLLLFNATFIFLIVVPGFYFLHIVPLFLIVVTLSLFAIASGSEQATTPVSIIENFPPPARYTGISLSYNIGNGFLGGTIPVICQWLLTFTNNIMAPAIYIAICAFITGMVIVFFIPETRGKSL